MNDRNWNIAGALSGIVFVALLVVSMAIAGDSEVEPHDPSPEIARVLADQSDQVGLASMIVLVGLVFFFGFLAYFRSRLQQAEGQGGWLTSVAYGGGLVTVAMVLLLVSMQLATTSVSAGSDTQVAKVFVVYEWNFIWVFAPPMIAFTLGASLAIVRYGVLPRWTAWLGFLVTLSLLMPWIGVIAVAGWIAMVSVVLLVQALRGTAPSESPASALGHPHSSADLL